MRKIVAYIEDYAGAAKEAVALLLCVALLAYFIFAVFA
jgi:hypothetical protein